MTQAASQKPVIVFVVAELSFFLSHRLPAARAAQAAGLAVHVLTHRTPSIPASHPVFKQFVIQDIGRLERQGLVWQVISKSWRIRRYLKAVRPRAVHAFGLYPTLMTYIASRFLPLAFIAAITGLGYSFITRSWRTWCIRRAIRLVLAVPLGHKSKVFIFQNEDDRRHFPRLAKQARIIRGAGVDTDRFRPSPLPSKTTPLIIATACRLLQAKGIVELADAVTKLGGEGIPIRLRVAGGEDRGNPDSVPAKTLKRLRASPYIDWLGQVAESDMPKFWRDCHVAALLSYGEGMPMVLMQGMASGRPILTTDSNGCRDLIDAGKNGVLIPPRNTEAAVAAIRQLAKADLPRMGKHSRHHFQCMGLSSKKVAEAHATLYAGLIAKQGGST